MGEGNYEPVISGVWSGGQPHGPAPARLDPGSGVGQQSCEEVGPAHLVRSCRRGRRLQGPPGVRWPAHYQGLGHSHMTANHGSCPPAPWGPSVSRGAGKGRDGVSKPDHSGVWAPARVRVGRPPGGGGPSEGPTAWQELETPPWGPSCRNSRLLPLPLLGPLHPEPHPEPSASLWDRDPLWPSRPVLPQGARRHRPWQLAHRPSASGPSAKSPSKLLEVKSLLGHPHRKAGPGLLVPQPLGTQEAPAQTGRSKQTHGLLEASGA